MEECVKLMDRNKNEPELVEKITFGVLGLSSVVGWNAVLTSLDYMDGQFEEYNLSLCVIIIYALAKLIFSSIVPIIRKHMSIRLCIIISMIVMCLCLTSIPISIHYFANNSAGFFILFATSFLLGMSNALLQGTVISLTYLAHEKLQTIYWTLNGCCGVVINVVNGISLLAFPSSLQKGTIFYYAISVLFISLSAFNFNAYYSSKYSTQTIHYKNNLHSLHSQIFDDSSSLSSQYNSAQSFQRYESEKKKQEECCNQVGRSLKQGFPIPLLICLLFMQQQLVFPYLAVLKVKLEWYSEVWDQLFLLAIANGSDSIGKYLGGIVKNQDMIKVIVGLMLLRCMQIPLFVLTAYYTDKSEYIVFSQSYFIVINLVVYSLLNGFSVSALMLLSPTLIKDSNNDAQLKQYLGYLNSFFLAFGTLFGTFLSLSFTNLGIQT